MCYSWIYVPYHVIIHDVCAAHRALRISCTMILTSFTSHSQSYGCRVSERQASTEVFCFIRWFYVYYQKKKENAARLVLLKMFDLALGNTCGRGCFERHIVSFLTTVNAFNKFRDVCKTNLIRLLSIFTYRLLSKHILLHVFFFFIYLFWCHMLTMHGC